MDLATFRNKLFNLQEQKALSNEELYFLNSFNTLEEIYETITSLANDSDDFILKQSDKFNISLKHKKEIESVWFKILNTNI